MTTFIFPFVMCGELICPATLEVPEARARETGEALFTLGVVADAGTTCDAQYGQNPDLCYLEPGHTQRTHTNKYGCEWVATPRQT